MTFAPRAALRALAALAWCFVEMGCGTSNADTPEPDAGPSDGVGDSSLVDPSCMVQAPTSCPSPAPTYEDVTPIFEARCIICHSGAIDGPWPLTAYEHVADWQDAIRAELLDCSMPPPDAGVPITKDERLAILNWIRCGLPE